MSKLNEVFKKYDPKTEAEWKEFNGAKFLIAPMGNKAMQKKMMKTFTLEEATEFETKGASVFQEKTAESSMARLYHLFSGTLILDWDLTDDDEKVIVFDENKCAELMVDNVEFGTWVMVTSGEVQKNRLRSGDEIAKK